LSYFCIVFPTTLGYLDGSDPLVSLLLSLLFGVLFKIPTTLLGLYGFMSFFLSALLLVIGYRLLYNSATKCSLRLCYI
jgi:hypothetical protein